jgi:hypothetical protein
VRIDKRLAEEVLRAEAALADAGPLDPHWMEKIETLSVLCEEADVRTHIAFFGVVALAKSVDRRADLFAVKPKLAKGNPYAFSARTLIYDVLAPLAPELGYNLGVTGREPLNNQPYFRMKYLGDDTPVHAASRAPFEFMLGLVSDLNKAPDEDSARLALRAFIAVRRRYQPVYAAILGEARTTPDELKAAVKTLVGESSEEGRRAQGVSAALFDVLYGVERVESGRINDPSRKYPGDVCIAGAQGWEKAVEVRDKVVRASDVQMFAIKCVSMDVLEAAVLMVAANQPRLDEIELEKWATKHGLSLTLFHGWDSFIDQVLFWSPLPKLIAANMAVERIHARLMGVEASPAAVERWLELLTH